MRDLVRRRKRDDSAVRQQDESPRVEGCGTRGRINPTVSVSVIAEAQNALEAAHTSGDYRFQSVGDLIRAALLAYSRGLRLRQQARNGRKKRHTVELPPDLMAEYQRLPSRSRGEILERALLSFLAQGYAKPE